MSHESKDHSQNKTVQKTPLKDDELARASGGMQSAALSEDVLDQATGGIAPQLSTEEEI